MKPIHELIADFVSQNETIIANQAIMLEKINRIYDVIIPPVTAPEFTAKDPEQLKADIIATVNDAFKNVGVDTPIVDSTVVQDVEPIIDTPVVEGEVLTSN